MKKRPKIKIKWTSLAKKAVSDNYNAQWQQDLQEARAERKKLQKSEPCQLVQKGEMNKRIQQARQNLEEPFFDYEEHACNWSELMQKRDAHELNQDGYRVVRMYTQLLDLCERNWPCLITLCQLIHWEMMNRKADKQKIVYVKGIPTFYKAAAELALETGLSEDAVDKSYRRLEKLHIIARGRKQIGGSPISVIYLNYKLITEAYHATAGKIIELAKARRQKIGKKEFGAEVTEKPQEVVSKDPSEVKEKVERVINYYTETAQRWYPDKEVPEPDKGKLRKFLSKTTKTEDEIEMLIRYILSYSYHKDETAGLHWITNETCLVTTLGKAKIWKIKGEPADKISQVTQEEYSRRLAWMEELQNKSCRRRR